ncbi:MAG: hypothetical protein J6U96_00490 [Elusimicrobiaceae bacterium]|nr:hypothetical protein [Elusimicrobiaceae bacterium]
MKKVVLMGLMCLLGITALQAQVPQKQFTKQLEKALLSAVKQRQEQQTVNYLQAVFEKTGAVDGCLVASIMADSDYMGSLTDEELALLADSLENIDFTKGINCGRQMGLVATEALEKASFDETARDLSLNLFYETVLMILSDNEGTGPAIEKWAFEQVRRASIRGTDVKSGEWASLLLLSLSGQENPAFDRQAFEKQLEEIIPQFDWLQNEQADYLTRLGKIKSNKVWHKTNQSVLLSLFAQANNFFAYKDDETFLSGMVSTGGLNSAGRPEGAPRFSDDGELYYLHHPTPGTDGDGHFADSINGRKHHVLAELVYALFTSYSMREDRDEASALMEKFVREYVSVHGGEFKHYLYIPLQAMRAGKQLLNTRTIDGWDKEKAALEKELYTHLKQEYAIYVGVASVQGAAEVGAEWEAFGGAFALVGKGFKLAGKGIGKVWVKTVPKRTRVLLRQNTIERGYKLVGKDYKKARHARWAQQQMKAQKDRWALKYTSRLNSPEALAEQREMYAGWVQKGWISAAQLEKLLAH